MCYINVWVHTLHTYTNPFVALTERSNIRPVYTPTRYWLQYLSWKCSHANLRHHLKGLSLMFTLDLFTLNTRIKWMYMACTFLIKMKITFQQMQYYHNITFYITYYIFLFFTINLKISCYKISAYLLKVL